MPNTAKTIAKMQRYASACDSYQIISCEDISTLLNEIERLQKSEFIGKDFKAIYKEEEKNEKDIIINRE